MRILVSIRSLWIMVRRLEIMERRLWIMVVSIFSFNQFILLNFWKWIRNNQRINVFICLTSFQLIICGQRKSRIDIAQIIRVMVIKPYQISKNVSKNVSREKCVVRAFRTVISMMVDIRIGVTFAWMTTWKSGHPSGHRLQADSDSIEDQVLLMCDF